MVSDVLSDANGRGQGWMRAWNEPDKTKRHAMIREMCKGYQAIVDCPVNLMPKDFVEVFPKAKFILTTRNSAEQWRESFSKTLDLTYAPWWYISTWMFPATRMLVLQIAPKWEAQNKAMFDGATVYRTKSTDIYPRYNEYCRNLFKNKEELLEYRAGEGWERLCEFLGKDIPDQPYPKVFVKAENRKWFIIGALMGMGIWAAGITACVGAWWFGPALLRKIQSL
jgi:hypothetical protein